jgi:hypothetical protein
MPTNTYVELRKETVGTATSSVTLSLSGITGYSDLVLVCNAQSASGSAQNLLFQLNGDNGSGNLYSSTWMTGNGSSPGSSRLADRTTGLLDNSGYAPVGSGFNNIVAHFNSYSNSTTYKTVLSRAGSAATGTDLVASLWRNTAPITSIKLFFVSNNISVGSTFSLYGIKATQVYTPSTIPTSLSIGDQILVPYTGSATTLSIPAGINTMRIELAGACGGGSGNPIGPYGAYVAGDYTIGGSALTMYAYVGGKGAQRADTNRAGGFNGGGSASLSPNGGAEYTSGSGGGATDIRVGGTELANRIFVAGGGGGGGGDNTYQSGGYGGYTEGNPGSGETVPNPFSGARGLGGTQSAGGAGGAGASDGSPAGQAGSLGQGGNGAQGSYGASGGGGGGYYGGGGGGGANNGGSVGGGGGSSFLGSLTNTTFINGSNNNNGYALLTKLS